MGDPKFSRKKYYTPSHPWEKDRIEREKDLVKKYGLKNKREIWKAQSVLRNFRKQARDLMARIRVHDEQALKEVDQLKKKLFRLGLLPAEGDLDDILALSIEDILNRRLQTVVYMKGMARTPRQARQFIVHGHIAIGDRVVNTPGRLITKKEEEEIKYSEFSPLSDELHPARPKEEDFAPTSPSESEKGGEQEKKEKIKISQKAKKVIEEAKKMSEEGDESEEGIIEEEKTETPEKAPAKSGEERGES